MYIQPSTVNFLLFSTCLNKLSLSPSLSHSPTDHPCRRREKGGRGFHDSSAWFLEVLEIVIIITEMDSIVLLLGQRLLTGASWGLC